MLGEIEGQGWLMVEPPLASDDENTVARLRGEPIKAGFRIEPIEETEDEFHATYRSGKYNLELKIDFGIGRGQVKVECAEGYDE
jgi:hypothetical protein